jgi:acyl CoA:acetate/3-ketoacid CoA transferase alpha subunit/acyl CoA:acetate/3-ketoacid CoA transferase beta subunit
VRPTIEDQEKNLTLMHRRSDGRQMMFGEFEEAVAQTTGITESGLAADKVMTLSQAVERFVRPGMHLHLGHSFARPTAAYHELVRQFWGKDAGFTISSLGFTGDMSSMFRAGIIKKAIATFYGDSYPMPGPNPVFQAAYRAGTVQMEHWTILTFSLRLLAGAMGFDWIPAPSLLGTNMQDENAADYFVTETPEGRMMGFARAMRPDISFIHGWAADHAGNVVCALPYAETASSARAAREGAIVTVEKVVDRPFIRRNSHLVKVPSYLVKAVCPVPLGSHPAGMSNHGLESEMDGYEVDRDFIIDLRNISGDKDKLQAWIDEWILGCADRDEYVAKLGADRVIYLKEKALPDSWRKELAGAVEEMNPGPEYNPVENMVCAGSRLLVRKARDAGYKTMLAGVGASNLAAWLAYYSLRREGYDIDLIAEVGFYGYNPQPAEPYIFNLANVPQCRMLSDINDVLGSLVNAESNRCIGSLGAGQVDRHGNVNSTCIPDLQLFLVGSGGAADVAAGAQDVVILIDHLPFRLVEEVPYVTCPGSRITAVVTTRGVLEKRGGDLVLTGYYPVEEGREAALAGIRENCGWELKAADDLVELERPSLEELRTLRIFDPHSYFLGS